MIARKRASYTRTPIGSRAREENCQQLHDPGWPPQGRRPAARRIQATAKMPLPRGMGVSPISERCTEKPTRAGPGQAVSESVSTASGRFIVT
jgi:hypothetical protein